jgi:hypothetical protein
VHTQGKDREDYKLETVGYQVWGVISRDAQTNLGTRTLGRWRGIGTGWAEYQCFRHTRLEWFTHMKILGRKDVYRR